MEFKIKDLSLGYYDGGTDNIILKNVTLDFGEKGTNVFIGPSGTGKSSLLYMLAGLRKPTSGQILYNGVDITKIDEPAIIRYSDFGFVFQQHYLIPYLTVLENICMGKRDLNLKKESMELLDVMGMANLANKKPYELSGGQKQRVAIARAIVKKPKIIFADEPTASLDAITAKQIYTLLKEFSKDSILFVATHDLNILEKDEQLYSIEDNKIVKKNIVSKEMEII